MPNPHDLIDRQRLIDRTAELIRLPSVNPFDGPGGDTTGEAGIAAWMADHLDRLGFRPTIEDLEPGRPNVVGTGPGGSGPVLCLAGHTDTVGVTGYDDPFAGTVAGGRIQGRGACDMKGALAAFIEVAEVLAASGRRLSGRLMIAGLADEEHAMIGSRALGRQGSVADQVIVGEPTGLRICTTHKGQYAFAIETFGHAVHSSLADQGVNAIEHMMEILDMLGGYRRDLAAAEPHPLCGTATVNPGVIAGGEIASMVPDHCRLDVDRRLLPGERTADIVAELSARIERVAADRPEFRWKIAPPTIDAAPLDTAPTEPVVVAARAAMARQGLDHDLHAFTGATDAPNLLAPAVIWGPGSLAQAHTTDEWLAVDELVTAAHLYVDTALAMLG